MADPLVAAMKLRQAKAEQERRYREEQRMLLESGAGPTTTPISGEQTSPFPIIGDAAVNDAQAYGQQVYDAAAPQAERAMKGAGKGLLDMFMGSDEEGGGVGAEGFNAALDVPFGSLNTAFSPLAPPMAAGLQPALESEGGQKFVQGLDALGTDIEASTGISKENQLDLAGWVGLPVAGAGLSRGVKAGVKALSKKKPVVEAPPRELSVADFDGSDVDRMVKYYSDRGREAVAKNSDPYAAMRLSEAESAPLIKAEADNTIPNIYDDMGEVDPAKLEAWKPGFKGTHDDLLKAEKDSRLPDSIFDDTGFINREKLNELRTPITELNAEMVSPLKADWAKQGTELYKNPTMRDLRRMSKDAPYAELRFLADRETGDTYFWPSEYALHADALKSLGFPSELGDRFIQGYTNAPTINLVKGVDELVNYDFGRKGSISDKVRNDPKFWKERWQGKDKRAASPLDEPRGQVQEVSSRRVEDMSPEAIADEYRQWAKSQGGTIDDAIDALRGEESAWPKDTFKEVAVILEREAAPEFYDQSKTPLYNRIKARSPLDELDGIEQRGAPQELKAIASDGSKPKPASVGVKVKPGQSLWDVVSGKTFQAGDDVLRANAAMQKQKTGQMSADQAAIIASKKETQRIIDANKAANAKKIDDYASAPNPLKDVDIDQLVPTAKAQPRVAVPRRVTVMPEGKMDGRKSGAKNVEIVTSPDVRDFAKAAKGNVYDEARFLVEEDGVVHTWPAEAGWHNDIADFLGIAGDKYHGVLRKAELDAAIKNGAKTMQDVIEFTQQPAWWGPFKEDYGLKNLPEWQAAEKALADSYTPQTKKQADLKFNSPLAELDNAPVAPEQPKSGVQKWMSSREDPAKAYLDDQRNATMTRKKGEPLVGPRGYTELQAKRINPLDELDNPGGEIAAARARSEAMNSYKAEQPAATKPERAADMKQKLREAWLNPDRPVKAAQDSPLPSIVTARKKVDEAFSKSREGAFQPHEGDITTKTLSEKVGTSLQEHMSMTPEQRRVNLAAAEKRLLDYMPDPQGNGRPSDFMNENKKLMKTRIGYDGGEPVTLPNGQTIESTGLSLSPSTEMKGFKTCPNSLACREACLGLKSGQYYLSGEEGAPQAASRYRTTALLSSPEAAAVKIFEEIAARRRKAAANGSVLGVRMNVLSDVDPKVWKPLMDHFDDVIFYDYTKMKYEPVAPNHHYTYSSTGVSSDMVSNKNANWSQMRGRLDSGDNVAMAFSTKEAFPKWVVDQETGKRYRVVDGVSHDFRPIDLQDGGKEGVIVGLKNMDLTTKEATADISSGGFIVKYEPNWKREGKTGKGKLSRDESGNPIAQNDTVYIQSQTKESARSTRPGESGTKTGPQTQIKIGGEDRTPVMNREVKSAEEINDYDALPLDDLASPLPTPKKRAAPSAYSKLDRKRKDAEKKKRELQQQDVADRMYARLNMQDHAPRMDKNQPRRTFEEDYPSSAENPFPALQHPDFWAHGKRVEVDVDGFPIDPEALIFGRQEVGGTDKGHSPRRIREMAEALMKSKNPKASVEDVYRPGASTMGKFTFSKGMKTGDVFPERIVINKSGAPWLQDQTLAHEAGHAIEMMGSNAAPEGSIRHLDAVTGADAKDGKLSSTSLPHRADISPKLEAEFRDLYSEVNENFGIDPKHKGLPKSPERTGYPEHFSQAELLAEALRLYMYDPGYIKARFPNAAAYLRKVARQNPDVAKHVRFNEASAGLAGVMATKFLAEQQQGDR